MQDQVFLFENGDHMWFDPSESCWHCLLIKGEHSREGILVEAEGYCYATHSLKTVVRNTQAHDPNSPLLCGQILPEDMVKERAVKSCKEEQLRFY